MSGGPADTAARVEALTEPQVAALIAELLHEWREVCRETGMPYTDKDAAAFIAAAYPCNRLLYVPSRPTPADGLRSRVKALRDDIAATYTGIGDVEVLRRLREILAASEYRVAATDDEPPRATREAFATCSYPDDCRCEFDAIRCAEQAADVGARDTTEGER